MDYLAPDWNSSALVTIDTQVDTLDGQRLEIPGDLCSRPTDRGASAVRGFPECR